ncbi:MAG: hypothetical protein LBO02_03180 [Holosporaceae bacterium]|nr:hypothetical protein [Holosporaceae bacterium]
MNLYLEGCGFRRIKRPIGISNVTVMKWVRARIRLLPDL